MLRAKKNGVKPKLPASREPEQIRPISSLIDCSFLACPGCSGVDLHLVGAEIRQGHVSCAASNDLLKAWEHLPPEGGLGSTISIFVSCEECHEVNEFSHSFHKGGVWVSVIRHTCMDYFDSPEMWRA